MRRHTRFFLLSKIRRNREYVQSAPRNRIPQLDKLLTDPVVIAQHWLLFSITQYTANFRLESQSIFFSLSISWFCCNTQQWLAWWMSGFWQCPKEYQQDATMLVRAEVQCLTHLFLDLCLWEGDSRHTGPNRLQGRRGKGTKRERKKKTNSGNNLRRKMC